MANKALQSTAKSSAFFIQNFCVSLRNIKLKNTMKVEFTNGSYIQQGNCFDLLDTLEAGSVDAIITDPPYTDGRGKDALKGHKIQTVIDIPLFMQKANRVLKPNSFLAFTMQTPYDLAWRIEAMKYFEHKNQAVWNKKNGNVRQLCQLEDIVENIFIFRKGKPKYNKVNAPYEEQVRMNIDNGAKIDSIFRELSYWKGIAQGKELQKTVQPNKQRNDKVYDRGIYERSSSVLGREIGNIKNIWAYNSHNLEYRNPENGQIKHTSVKPIDLFIRLIELLTPDPTPDYVPLIVDPFIGSGTTCIAGAKTKRRFIGFELLDEGFYETNEAGEQVWIDGYFTISQKRILKAFKELQDAESQQTIF